MRDIPLKTDSSGDTLPADRFNANLRNELQNVVEAADNTLDPDGGPDTDLNMMNKAVAAYSNAGNAYEDSGAADAYVLAIASNLKPPFKYYSNMKIAFKAGNSNTGASTVNIAGIGVKNITNPDGSALTGLKIVAGTYVFLVYNLASDRFELIPLSSTIELFTPTASSAGVVEGDGFAEYTFDDWDGVAGFLTGSNGFVVPYKKSLSNVFTGFEVIGWLGNGSSQIITPKGLGLHWIKNRDDADGNFLFDLLRAATGRYWQSESTAVDVTGVIEILQYTENSLKIGNNPNFNALSEKYISWNWSFPLVKAWHANGAASRKVPTPWGIVDSVASNASSGLVDPQVAIELYNPLTGNGCILYVGTPNPRLLDISGGIAPEFMVTKRLDGATPSTTYHSGFNGGVTPAKYYIDLNSTSAEALDVQDWNDTEPTANLISIGNNNRVNASTELMILYYFAPVAGLQAFGGYAGNGGANNQATGCKDGMFFVKGRAGGTGTWDWSVVDHFRGDSTPLRWNSTLAEQVIGNLVFGAVSGMEINTNYTNHNAIGDDYAYGHFGKEMVPQGNADDYPTAPKITTGSNNKAKIILQIKTGLTINTEFKVHASREATPNWVLGTLAKTADLSDGYEQWETEIDISGNAAGTSLRWRIQQNEAGPTYQQFDITKLRIEYS